MSFKNFYNKSLFLEAVRGEYWIDSSGSPWYADGDVSDVNHSNYILGLVVGDILDDLNVQIRGAENYGHLYDYFDEIFEEIKDGLTPELIEKWDESRKYRFDIILHLIGDNPQNRDKLSIAFGMGDPRDYGLKYMGYKRVKGDNLQTFTLTQRDFEVIKRGLESILTDEGFDDDEQLKNETLNIEVMSNGHFFRDVPYMEFLEGNLQGLLHYRGK